MASATVCLFTHCHLYEWMAAWPGGKECWGRQVLWSSCVVLGLAIVVFPPLKLLEATYCDEEDKGTALGKLYLWWGRGTDTLKWTWKYGKWKKYSPVLAVLCSVPPTNHPVTTFFLVPDNWGRPLWSPFSYRAGLSWSPCRGGREKGCLFPKQCAAPLAFHHPGLAGTGSQEILWTVLHRLLGPHQ